jgi:hypothetical protein
MNNVSNPLTIRTSPSDVHACTDQLERALSNLQERYGIAAVVAALIDVAGCRMSVDHAMRGSSLRAFVEKIGRHQIDPPSEARPA